MVEKGQQLENPATGQSLLFRVTSAESGGELLEVESTWKPSKRPPPAHYHPYQEEHFEVTAGLLNVIVDGEKRTLNRGDTLVIPPGTAHAMWNPGPEDTSAIWQVRPALKTGAFFETMWRLAQETNGKPNLFRLAVAVREFDAEFRLVSPPRPVQQVMFGAFAFVGRLLGYRGR